MTNSPEVHFAKIKLESLTPMHSSAITDSIINTMKNALDNPISNSGKNLFWFVDLTPPLIEPHPADIIAVVDIVSLGNMAIGMGGKTWGDRSASISIVPLTDEYSVTDVFEKALNYLNKYAYQPQANLAFK